MRKFAFLLFAVMCLAQWVIPGKMIYDSEHIIDEGIPYKFRTAPIDPSDPFRGKYITLNFQENFFLFEDSADWQTGQEIFVTFKMDSAGFAVTEHVFNTKPESATYLRTTVDYVDRYQKNHKVWYKLPFNRFYLEESKASEAEKIYWQAQRDSAQIAYALVNIGQGRAVLRDVFINDKPILDIVFELNRSNE